MRSIPTFPAVDLSHFDLSRLEPAKLVAELRPILDRLPGTPVDADRVAGVLRDATYVVVGLGVLAVQQVQVRRRELDQKLEAVQTTLGEAVDEIGQRLPEPARAVLGQAQDLVTAARTQVRERLRTAA